MPAMPTTEDLARYLESVLGRPIEWLQVLPLVPAATPPPAGAGKTFGYGKPLLLKFLAGGREQRVVLQTVRPGRFGHEHMSDRAAQLLWSHHTYSRLARHARSLDLGGFRPGRPPVSLSDVEEAFLLTEFVDGAPYADDLARLRGDGTAGPLDFQRADALCDYLLEIHSVRGTDSGLYVRRARELLGHGECIMGVADSYPYPAGSPPITPDVLEAIERLCVRWRWRLRDYTHRLRQVHGDFHPWNILFRAGTDFSVLDRSRGEFGEPADDVTCITMNYLFFSLQAWGRLSGDYGLLFDRFWNRYLRGARDTEVLAVAPPFIAFRALVMANPLWYPSLIDEARAALLSLAQNVLEDTCFEPQCTNAYCGL